MEELVKQSMENREYVKNVYDMLFDQKLTELLRSKLNIDHQKGDVKAFVDMLTARADKSKVPAKKAAAKKATAKKVKEDNEEVEEKEVKAKKAPAKAKTAKTTKTKKEE